MGDYRKGPYCGDERICNICGTGMYFGINGSWNHLDGGGMGACQKRSDEVKMSDSAQEECIYCGPKCYGGAAHWARKEDSSLYAERNPPNLYKMSRLILRALLMERFKRNPTDSEMDTHWQMYAREVEAKR